MIHEFLFESIKLIIKKQKENLTLLKTFAILIISNAEASTQNNHVTFPGNVLSDFEN